MPYFYIKCKNDHGLQMYSAYCQGFKAIWSLCSVNKSDGIFRARTPFLKCRDTLAAGIVHSKYKKDMEDDLYGCMLTGTPMKYGTFSVVIRINSVDTFLKNLRILHMFEVLVGSELTEVHNIVSKDSYEYGEMVGLVCPPFWGTNVVLMSLFCLITRLLHLSWGAESLEDFFSEVDLVIKGFRDKDEVVPEDLNVFSSTIKDLDIIFFLTNLGDILGDKPFNGFDNKPADSIDFKDIFAQNSSDICFNRICFYGISSFSTDIKKVMEGYTVSKSIGRGWRDNYEELYKERGVDIKREETECQVIAT